MEVWEKETAGSHVFPFNKREQAVKLIEISIWECLTTVDFYVLKKIKVKRPYILRELVHP